MKKNQLLLSPDGDSAGSPPEQPQPAKSAKPASPPKPSKPAKPAAKGKVPAKPAAKGKVPAKPAAKAPAKGKAEKPAKEPVVRQKQNGLTRPTGERTAIVWDLADKLSAKAKEPATRAAVLAACAEKGVNEATAATQFGRWRRFHGISGRSATK